MNTHMHTYNISLSMTDSTGGRVLLTWISVLIQSKMGTAKLELQLGSGSSFLHSQKYLGLAARASQG